MLQKELLIQGREANKIYMKDLYTLDNEDCLFKIVSANEITTEMLNFVKNRMTNLNNHKIQVKCTIY